MVIHKKTLLEVIELVPSIATAVLPIYLPLVWFAYSSGRKMNLSKRLIEEYSHKETSAKTYEGLATQVEGLDGNEELKKLLLSNLLSTTAENPGKLISSHNDSGHPVEGVLKKAKEATAEWIAPEMKKGEDAVELLRKAKDMVE